MSSRGMDAAMDMMGYENRCPSSLTVTDVERLAKAGVKVEFNDIKHQIVQDPLREDHAKWVRLPLVDSFWERWHRANPPDYNMLGCSPPWQIFASEHGDTVYVFVQPENAPPFIIEDQKHLYPSDALMAALHLYGKTK